MKLLTPITPPRIVWLLALPLGLLLIPFAVADAWLRPDHQPRSRP